jgi:hypothetical protein
MDIIKLQRTLVCKARSRTTCDEWIFRIDELYDDLTATWKIEGYLDGDVFVSSEALDGGTKLMDLTQGNISRYQGIPAETLKSGEEADGDWVKECEEECGCHTPPFLLGRAALKELRAGKSVEISVFGDGLVFKKVGPAERELEIDGTKMKVGCLHAADGGFGLWVVDDDKWPVILRVETMDNRYCELLSVGSDPSDQADDDDDEDDDED